jgi:hypothetical protein
LYKLSYTISCTQQAYVSAKNLFSLLRIIERWKEIVIIESALQFYPLTFVPDGDEIIVGRVGGDSFAAFPPDGVALLKQMQAGMTPQEASVWYQRQYEETIDIDDFLQTLQEMNFIYDPATEQNHPSSNAPTKRNALWMLAGKALFSPVAWLLYGGLCAYCVFLIVLHPYLFPNYQQVFFSPYYTVIELGLFFSQFPPIFLHELFHVLAGHRQGISSRLGIGRRLYFVVFETDLTGLWGIPPKARYLPFLAGMLADMLFFSLMTIIAALTYIPGHPYSFPSSFCMAMAFSTVIRFLWQFYFFLETDIYYVLTNALHCINLQQTTRHYILNRFYRAIGRRDKLDDEARWSPRDRRVAPWYAPVFLLGYAISLGIFLLAGLPVAYRFLLGIFNHLFHTIPFGSDFWDACIFLGLNLLQLAVIAFLILRERKRRKRMKTLQ